MFMGNKLNTLYDFYIDLFKCQLTKYVRHGNPAPDA